MTIQDKVKNLLSLRAELDAKKEEIKPLQAQKDELQTDIIKHLKKSGFKSVKTDKANVSIATSKRLSIKSERDLVEDLKAKGLNDMVAERVNSMLWQPFARQAMKDNVEFAGTEVVESEYISVRTVKGKEVEKDD